MERAAKTEGSTSSALEDRGGTTAQLGEDPPDFERGFRFWAIIIGLGITTLLAALEHTVVTTSAPAILTDLELGANYVWLTNAFFVYIIVSDLIPLRQRGKYMAIILAIFGIGTSLGPFIGGAIITSTTWRWVFYINLPIGGTSLITMYLFLHVNYNKEMSFTQKLRRIDFIGNGILTTGVSLLPQSLVGIPGAAIAAIALSRWGKFKPIHFAGFSIATLGLGLFSLQKEDTHIAAWVIFQCICALGIGMVLDTLLPAFQAPVAEEDQAAATATWSFVRAFGSTWGVAIPAAVFNSYVDKMVSTISDPAVQEQLASGGAYQHASASFVSRFTLETQNEVRAVYRVALQRVFQISVAFSGVAVLLALLEREVALRKKLETQYGLKKDVGESSGAKSGEVSS
ncbi:hypothetical protein SLS62_001547 [Diatrype stigma]|uniref:Major facilitator superfamily (MFS) profile domain-containing protein n=1 Tax=Diatrype stigma TaxID=117547 RepID=A0AAN9YT77_9PEZI